MQILSKVEVHQPWFEKFSALQKISTLSKINKKIKKIQNLRKNPLFTIKFSKILCIKKILQQKIIKI